MCQFVPPWAGIFRSLLNPWRRLGVRGVRKDLPGQHICYRHDWGKVNQPCLLLLRKYTLLGPPGRGRAGATRRTEVRSYFKQAPLRLTEFKFNTTVCVKKLPGLVPCDDVNKLWIICAISASCFVGFLRGNLPLKGFMSSVLDSRHSGDSAYCFLNKSFWSLESRFVGTW